MFCGKYGAEISGKDEFCWNCGNELESRSRNPSKKDDKKIEVSKISKYIDTYVNYICDNLVTFRTNDFVKYWINYAVLAVLEEYEGVILNYNDYKSLRNINTPFNIVTDKSLSEYLNINILYFLVIFPKNKDNLKSLKFNKITAEQLKRAVFNFFNYDEKYNKLFNKLLALGDDPEIFFIELYKEIIRFSYEQIENFDMQITTILFFGEILKNSFINFIKKW
jgi:hypothetical protein